MPEHIVIIEVKKELATWLVGFLSALLAPLKLENLNTDTMNARAIMDATQKGLTDAEQEDTDKATV